MVTSSIEYYFSELVLVSHSLGFKGTYLVELVKIQSRLVVLKKHFHFFELQCLVFTYSGVICSPLCACIHLH
jgi:hypothetical protein